MSSPSLLHSQHAQLDVRLRQVGRRSERLQLCYGVSCFLSVVLLAGFICGLADYVGRFQQASVRFALAGTFCAVTAAAFLRFVRPLLGFRRSNLAIARRVEDRFPQLRDKLSSAASFLNDLPGGPLGGSQELQRMVIADASAEVERLDLMDCLDDTLPRRAAVGTLATLALVAVVCYTNPDDSFLAARRMLMPWRNDPWPRWNSLSFQSPPRKLASGADFEAELIDLAGHLPDEVTIEYWFAGDPREHAESRRMKRVAGRMVDRYSNLARSFKFRASGGDDDTMPWLQVDVVEPPRIEELRIDVRPPEYARRPEHRSGRNIVALEGATITLWGQANKPISSIEITGTMTEERWQIRPQLAADRLSFDIPGGGPPLFAAESGTFGLVVVDDEGIAANEELTCTLQVVPDLPPSITVDVPAERAYFTPEARVPLEALVSDDLEIDAVMLQYRGNEVPLPAPAGSASSQEAAADTRAVRFEWVLNSIQGLAVGDVLEYEVSATDRRPQTGTSGVRRVTIVSEAELLTRLAERVDSIRDSLNEALNAQRAARSHLERLAPQAADLAQWNRQQIDAAQSIALSQHHVGRLISDRSNGVDDRIGRLLQDAASNGLERQVRSADLQSLSDGLRETGHSFIAPAEEQLGQAVRLARDAQADPTAPQRLGEMLNAAAALQDQAISRFEKMVLSLAQWEDVHQVATMLSRLRQQQRQLSASTRAAPTIGRDFEQLTGQEQQRLEELAEQQRELAEQLYQMLAAIPALAERTADGQPAVSDALRETLRMAHSQAVDGLLREAARSIERNRIGQASLFQQQVEETLDSMSGLVAQALVPPTTPLEMQARTELLNGLRAVLLQLHGGQVELAADTARADADSAPELAEFTTRQLAERQRVLQAELLKLSEKDSVQPSLRFLLARTRDEMDSAALNLSLGDTSQPTQQSQRSAARRLEIAAAALATEPSADPASETVAGPPAPSGPAGAIKVDRLELQLLQAMQTEVNRKTEEYSLSDSAPSSQQLDQLADEQVWLSVRIRELFEQADEDSAEELFR